MGGRQFSLPEWVDSWFVDLKNRGVADPKEIRDVLSYINSLKNTRCDELKKLRGKLRNTQIQKNEQIAKLKDALSREKGGHSTDVINLKEQLDKAKLKADNAAGRMLRAQSDQRNAEDKLKELKKKQVICKPNECEAIKQCQRRIAELGRNNNGWSAQYTALQQRHDEVINRYGKENGIQQMEIKKLRKEIELLQQEVKEEHMQGSRRTDDVYKQMREMRVQKNEQLRRLQEDLEFIKNGTRWERFKKWIHDHM